jgi:hypothetical protein
MYYAPKTVQFSGFAFLDLVCLPGILAPAPTTAGVFLIPAGMKWI